MKHLAILLLGLLAFTACSKDNEEGMSPTLSEKKKDYIAKIEFFYKPLGNNVKDYEKAGEYTFTYDKQKRLVGCTYYYNEFDDGHKSNCKMSYSENQIEFHKLESTYNGKRRYPEDFFIILDKQGKALQVNTYIYGSYLHSSNREYFKYIDAFFKHDSLGHCTSFAQQGFPSIIPLVWKNGNIESILYHTRGGVSKINPKPSGIDENYIYTNIPNRSYPDLNLFFADYHSSGRWWSLWSDVVGFRSAHMLSKILLKERVYRTFSHKLDSKGRVSETIVDTGISRLTKYIITYANI